MHRLYGRKYLKKFCQMWDFWCRIHLWFRLMGVCTASRWRHRVRFPAHRHVCAQHLKLTAMRYYGNVMTTIWRLRILHLQQYSRRLILFVCFWCRIHLWFRLVGGLYGKSMKSPRQIPGPPSRLRAQQRKLTAMRYYVNVMSTIWRLRILHLQQYSRRLNLIVCFFSLGTAQH